jgi:hypothetical protein
MPMSEFVDNVQRIKTCIISDRLRNYFKWFGEHVHNKLLLAWNLDSILFESLRKFHLCCSSTCYDLICLKASSNDHYCIIQRSFSLFDELLSPTPQNYRCWFSLWFNSNSTFGHYSKRLYLSAPICFYWKLPQEPKTSDVTLFTVVWRRAPVDFATLVIS